LTVVLHTKGNLGLAPGFVRNLAAVRRVLRQFVNSSLILLGPGSVGRTGCAAWLVTVFDDFYSDCGDGSECGLKAEVGDWFEGFGGCRGSGDAADESDYAEDAAAEDGGADEGDGAGDDAAACDPAGYGARTGEDAESYRKAKYDGEF
jgi:hypothetical protein